MEVWDWAAVIGSFVIIAGFLRIVFAKDRDDPRHAEEAAREYFDLHGRWPDEE